MRFPWKRKRAGKRTRHKFVMEVAMDEAGKNKLWANYAKTKSPEIREKLILEYAPLEIGRAHV